MLRIHYCRITSVNVITPNMQLNQPAGQILTLSRHAWPFTVLNQRSKFWEAAGKLPVPSHLLLRAAIESVWDSYDLIVIDSAPNLGIGTINVVCAADVIVVPTPAELYDYVSSLQFFTMLRDLIANVDLGGFEPTSAFW
ncbi:plasmid-partitioning protein SopA [Salmonella enterica subsp. enterica]|nr:plasmid-partitioning protein SopA [Salmonella enterica subsp. enterica]